MNYLKAAQTGEISPGEMKIVRVGERNILLVNVAGTYYALNNRCPHLGGSLGKGVLEGSAVTCPLHGSRFDVTNGKVLHNARIAFINMKVNDAKTYPVKIEGADILVGLE